MSAVHLVAAAEALCLGKRVGLDVDQLFRIIEGAAGSSRVFVERGRDITTGRWRGKKTVSETITQLVRALFNTSIPFPSGLSLFSTWRKKYYLSS